MRLAAPFSIALVLAASLLAACSAGSSGPTAGSSGPTLTGKTWALTAVTSKTPAFQGVVPAYQQSDYTITFNTDGTYSGTAACNQIAGTYKTSGSTLTITAGASPLALCPDSDFGLIFAHSLTNASTYAVTSNTLTITLTDGGTMRFGPPPVAPSSAQSSPQSSAVASAEPGASPPADLVDKVWKLTAITELTPAFQGVVPAAEQANYTIEFQADGTFAAKADCNQVAGTYEVYRGDGSPGPLEPGGGSISILPGPSTLAACPPGSMGDLYVVGLGNAISASFEGGQLTLTLVDGGKLVFGS
jgi:heat shock protein HslJ